MLQKEILKFFHHCWGLRVKKDITKSWGLMKTTLKNCGTKLNIIFSPFQHKCVIGWGTLLSLRTWL
jgi:hypothetical protein